MSVYRQAIHPYAIGELRMKAWSAILPPVVAQDDPTWAKRCKDYWELQQRLFGVVLSDFMMIIDANEGVVCTYATVLDVLPGERTLDYSRVPATRLQ